MEANYVNESERARERDGGHMANIVVVKSCFLMAAPYQLHQIKLPNIGFIKISSRTVGWRRCMAKNQNQKQSQMVNSHQITIPA